MYQYVRNVGCILSRRVKQIGSWQFHGITSTADSHKNIITSDSTFDFAWNLWFAALPFWKKEYVDFPFCYGPCSSLKCRIGLCRYFLKCYISTNFLCKPLNMSYSDVIKICTLWHKLAQYRTKLHKVAQKNENSAWLTSKSQTCEIVKPIGGLFSTHAAC